MYQTLVPCPSCRRHIRAAEAACPFCASAIPQDLARSVVPSATRRLSRAAAFVFGASVAVTGCGSTTTGGASGGGTSGGGSDTTASSGSGGDAGPDDDGGVVALYGDPAPDGGVDDDGGAQAEYGAPPPDAG